MVDGISVSVSEPDEASSSQLSARGSFLVFLLEVDCGFAKAGEDLEGVGWMERLRREEARSERVSVGLVLCKKSADWEDISWW